MTLPFCLPVLMSAILLPSQSSHLYFFKKYLKRSLPPLSLLWGIQGGVRPFQFSGSSNGLMRWETFFFFFFFIFPLFCDSCIKLLLRCYVISQAEGSDRFLLIRCWKLAYFQSPFSVLCCTGLGH